MKTSKKKEHWFYQVIICGLNKYSLVAAAHFCGSLRLTLSCENTMRSCISLARSSKPPVPRLLCIVADEEKDEDDEDTTLEEDVEEKLEDDEEDVDTFLETCELLDCCTDEDPSEEALKEADCCTEEEDWVTGPAVLPGASPPSFLGALTVSTPSLESAVETPSMSAPAGMVNSL